MAFHPNRVYEVAGFEETEGKASAILGIPFPASSDNPTPVRIILDERDPAAADFKKRPTVDQVVKGNAKVPALKVGGLLSVDFEKDPGDKKEVAARWIKQIAADPESREKRGVSAVVGRVFKNPKEGATFPYGLTVLKNITAVPSLDSLSSLTSEGQWRTGVVRIVGPDQKVIASASASLLPGETLTLAEKMATSPKGEEFLKKSIPEGGRVDVLLFDNHSISKQFSEENAKFLDNLATRKGAKEGERRPETRLQTMVIEFDPGSGKFVSGLHALGPRTVPAALYSPGEKLSWAEEQGATREAAASNSASPLSEAEAPLPHVEPETTTEAPLLPSLESLDDSVHPVTASLYADDEMSLS